MKENLILIGGGGHCKSCIEVIEETGKYCIAGILDIKEHIGNSVSGYKISGSDEDLDTLCGEGHLFLITIGQIKSGSLREKLYQRIKNLSGRLASVVSPKAHVSNSAVIGEGTIIMHGTIVNAHAEIGVNNILNTGSCVEHDVITGGHCHISTHAVINGECRIGENVFIGSNAVIINGVSIISGTVIGAGSVINKNIEVAGTYAGNPYRKIA